MTAEPSSLAIFWVGVIVVAIVVYVILDGFDLGIGILFGATKDKTLRDAMVATIAPYWDGNETWLIVIGASLFAAFPIAYAVFLSAFYIPVLLMLFGLIFRGVAFDYRRRDARRLWDRGFFVGSAVAVFMQGAAVGAMIRGIPVVDRQYAGGAFDWLAPLPVLCGIGLLLGDALLGAGWLVLKCEGEPREWARQRIPRLAGGLLVVLALAFVAALVDRERIGARFEVDRAWGVAFPGLGLLAMAGVFTGVRWRHDGLPFAMTVVFYIAAFLTLAVLFWPYMIPYQVTVAGAAAPEASLSFLSWGAFVVLPLIAIYTGSVFFGCSEASCATRRAMAATNREYSGGGKWERTTEDRHCCHLLRSGQGPPRSGAGVAAYFIYPNQVQFAGGEAREEILSLNAPPGTVKTEENSAYKAAASPKPVSATAPAPAEEDWPTYNKTLTTERFSNLSQINTNNVDKLKVLCTYNTHTYSSFETGLIKVEGALIGTTEYDIFSIDPATCAQNWRTHEDFAAYILPLNRGAAYLDGMLYRGTEDGRVLGYDFKTGKRVWETQIADPKKGETVPAAPIAWEGLVFIGNAGGDAKGGKGRMYALDGKTGKIVWEFYLVPKSADDPTRGPQGANPLDASTWKNIAGAPISGGGNWTSTTLDPSAGLLYVPVGNPAPDFDNQRAREREPVSLTPFMSCSTPRPALLKILAQDRAEGLA